MAQDVQAPPSRKQAALRLYVRAFLATGVSFAIVWGAMMALRLVGGVGWEAALRHVWGVALLGGLLFGAAMSLTLGTVALIATRRKGGDALSVRQSRHLLLRGTRDAVVGALAQVLASIPRARRPRVDTVVGTTEVRTRLSWKSFGERVTARLGPGDGDTQEVFLESRPTYAGTVIDYGANAANLDAVVAALRRRADVAVIGAMPPEAAAFD